MADESVDDGLPLKDLTRLVRDLSEPSRAIYWSNLVGGLVVAALGVYLSRPFPGAILSGSPVAICGFVVAVLAIYRITYFNHEIAHQARKLPGFALAWNATVGVPLLIPSFLYSDHRNHHSLDGFGSDSDVEYFPPEMRGFKGAVALVVLSFLLPFAYVIRFAVLAPAAWISRRIRTWVDTRASSLGILGLSRRAPPTASERPSWRRQELACFVYLVVVAAVLIVRRPAVAMAVHFYALFVAILLLHSVRIMAAHRYESELYPQGRVGQLLDSFNFTRNPVVTRLMAPLGFHLHALHHLFPNIPFHHMPEAHRRLAAALPADSPYHAAEAPSFFAAVAAFIARRPRTVARLHGAAAE